MRKNRLEFRFAFEKRSKKFQAKISGKSENNRKKAKKAKKSKKKQKKVKK
jgi:hypothetical protein